MSIADDIEGLEKLQERVDQFTGNIFDWVSFLGRVDFLHATYDFKESIEAKIAALKVKQAEKDALEALES